MPDSPPRRRSLRRRLMWAFTLLTTCALLIQAATLYLANEEQEEDLIDEVVATALDGIIERPAGQHPPMLGRHLSLFHAPVGTRPEGLPEPVAGLPTGKHEWFSKGTEFHIGIRDHAGERYFLLYDATEHEERLQWLLYALIAGVAGISLLSLWLARWISNALMQQLELLAANLSSEDSILLQPEQDCEVALLAGVLDEYRARNALLIAREREFTANVSHELRTPLTRIRTSAELMASGPQDHRRAQRMILAVDELERCLKGLLLLARGAEPLQIQSVLLQPLTDTLCDPYREECKSKGMALENSIPASVAVDADPALLLLLIDNLLRNAVKYTLSGTIHLAFENGWFILKDTGAGIPEAQQDQVFQRHFRGDEKYDGSGLGLHIVHEISKRCHWQYELKSQSGRGTEVRVRLQP